MKFRVNNYILKSQKIKSDKKILVLSDIHSNTNYLEDIINKINDYNIDYVFIPGDLIDFKTYDRKEKLIDIINRLSINKKVIISMGNHDSLIIKGRKNIYDEKCNDDFYNELSLNKNIIVLKDRFTNMKIDDINVSSININPEWFMKKEEFDYFKDFIDSIDTNYKKNEFNILLSHSPNGLLNKNEIINYDKFYYVDLILCGHNHGGLTPNFIQKKSKKHIGITGPYFTFIKKHAYGFYKKDNQVLLISNGVTKISKCSLFQRMITWLNYFFIPDIYIIELKHGSNDFIETKKAIIK